MTTILGAFLGFVWLLVLLPATVLLLEVLFGLKDPENTQVSVGNRVRLGILIPAHNEAANISQTICSIIPQLASTDRLLVVADNCSDDTARIAAAERAESITRRDAARRDVAWRGVAWRGKGYALDIWVKHEPNLGAT